MKLWRCHRCDIVRLDPGRCYGPLTDRHIATERIPFVMTMTNVLDLIARVDDLHARGQLSREIAKRLTDLKA